MKGSDAPNHHRIWSVANARAFAMDRRQVSELIVSYARQKTHNNQVANKPRWLQRIQDQRSKGPRKTHPIKRCYDLMEKQTFLRELLYARTAFPGEPIPCNMPHTPLNDCRPSDCEIRTVVKSLRRGRAGNVRGMKAKYLQEWLTMIEDEEKAQAEGNNGLVACGDYWGVLVQLI